MSRRELVLLAALGILAVILILAALVLPTLRQRELKRVLQQLLQDPGAVPELPAGLRSLGGELSALRMLVLTQRQEVVRQEQRRQELIAFLAHDLKTPLTSVLGYLQLLKDGPGLDAGQRARYTGIALDKARRLEELVGEFFDINTMELALEHRDPIQLSFLLEQLADEFYPLFGEKQLVCTPEIAPHLVVEGDGDRLARVFDNVLRNAVSYSERGSAVGLTARREAGQVVVRITNQGLDIPERELSNIFEKFYRLDAARSTRSGGAGLGLAIAREIVELHGGTIRAESTGGQVTFVISLPCMD